MLKTVRSYVEKWHMLTNEDRVIVGVSGGADSICLLLVLEKLREEIGFDMVAVHVNHGLRGVDADADEQFVKEFCASRGILCESYYENVELIAKKRKQSTEEAGREVRKAFFAEALCKYDGTKIALAHHQNDSAETFLLNLARGSGIKGLGGIHPVNGNIIRPLLCVTREQIETYMKENDIPYCVDQSNDTDVYARNRIRNHVLPYLCDEVNKRTVEHMNDTMEQVRQIQEFLEDEMQKCFAQGVQKQPQGFLIMQEAYEKMPEVLKPMLVKRVLVLLANKEKDLESVHLQQINELFEKQTSRKMDLPYRLMAKRVYDGVIIGPKQEERGEILFEKKLNLDAANGIIDCGGCKIQYQIFSREDINEPSTQKSYTKCFDCDIIRNGLSIRTRKQGDYISIHPDGRTQKLKTFFINEKIPQEERDKIMLVADGNHILWIVGYRVNPIYRITENTKHILKINIDKGEK